MENSIESKQAGSEHVPRLTNLPVREPATSHGPAPSFMATLVANAPDPRDWLAAIIEGSDDAIVSKDLRGIIQSWNSGATRLFGYEAEEVIGKPVTILIPEGRLDEEPAIIAEIQRGMQVEHFFPVDGEYEFDIGGLARARYVEGLEYRHRHGSQSHSGLGLSLCCG